MAYGTIKVDTVTFTSEGIDTSVSVSGLVRNPTFSGNITSTSTISGVTIQGGTLVSGATVTGSAGQFTTITGNTVRFTTITGTTAVITSGVFASGTAAAPSISVGTTTNGIYSPGADQVAVATNSSGRIVVGSTGTVNIVGDGTAGVTQAVSFNGSAPVNSLVIDSSGRLLVGTSTPGGAGIRNTVPLTGNSGSVFGYSSEGTLRSDVVTARYYHSQANTASNSGTPYTISNLSHVSIAQSAFNADSTVTNQYGVNVQPSLTGATNNYGFYSNIASGTGRWNFYANGTAANYFAGSVGVGTSAPESTLQVNGTVSFGEGSLLSSSILPHIYRSGGNLFIQGRTDGGPGGNIQLATASTIRLNISAGGNVGIGTASPSGTLHVTAASAVAPFIASGPSSEYARIDSSGRLLVGTSSAIAASTLTPGFQHQGTEAAFANAGFGRWTNDNGGYAMYFTKSRGTSVGSQVIVSSGDFLGALFFEGSDGTQLRRGASIIANVDGTPGANNMPGRLVFSTTADGASSPTERLRITNDGVQCYNQPAPAAVNATATLTAANLKAGIITSTSAAATDMTLPTGTDTQAGFSSTYDNFTFEWSVINTGPSLVRVLAATAHTIVGSGSVATGTSGRFASRRTAANTFVTYRLS